MRGFDLSLVIAALLALVLSGCHLPTRKGPVSRSLATCREYSQQGVAALEQGHPQQAETFLAKAVEACPADPEARRYYAEALWRRGARQEAITQLNEAARLGGEAASLQVRLAEMYLAVGQAENALRYAEQAIDLDPKLPSAWTIRAQVMHASGRLQQALADYHRALGYAPYDQDILLKVAELYRQRNQPQRALATLHTLAETYSPGDEPQRVLDLMGAAYLALGRHEDAVDSFSTAVIRETPTPELYYRLGQAELLAGHPAEAAAAAQHALRLQPQHQPSLELLDRVRLAGHGQTPPRH
jgi:tetratricopeptide (TPR) repeat protein